MASSKKAITQLKGVWYLILGLILGFVFWFGGDAPQILLGRTSSTSPIATPFSPIATPFVGNMYMTILATPRPPTVTPTRYPDDEPPVTTLKIEGTPNAQNWYRTPVTLTFDAVDNYTGLGVIRYRFADEVEWGRYDYFYPPVNVDTEGARTLYYYAQDANHNMETPHTAFINTDWTSPTITSTVQGWQLPNGWYNLPVTVTLNSQDNLSGITYNQLNLNNTGWLTATAPTVISQTGRYTLAYRALDQAGNRSAEEYIALNVDLIPPTTTHTLSAAPNANGWHKTPLSVTLTVTDTDSGPWQSYYRLNGGSEWLTYDGPVDINNEGIHTLTYFSTDNALNEESPQTTTLKIDLTPPTVTLPISSSLEYTRCATIPYTVSDAISGLTGVTTTLDSQVVTTSIDLFFVGLGVHTVSITAADQAGWVTEVTESFTLTATIPALICAKHRLYDLGEIYGPGAADIVNSLDAKLEAALRHVKRGKKDKAINQLNAFINEVEAQTDKHITPLPASLMISDAQAVIDRLSN